MGEHENELQRESKPPVKNHKTDADITDYMNHVVNFWKRPLQHTKFVSRPLLVSIVTFIYWQLWIVKYTLVMLSTIARPHPPDFAIKAEIVLCPDHGPGFKEQVWKEAEDHACGWRGLQGEAR